jgi:hypothetical protein
MDKTYMAALGDVATAISMDDDRAIRAVGTRQVAGMIPYSALTRGVTVAMDPELKEPLDALDYFQQHFPVLSQGVPEQVNRWGEPVKPVTGRFRGLTATGTPLAPSNVVEDQVAQELVRNNVGYGRVSRDFRKPDGSHIRLSRRQQLAWQQARGQAVRKRLQELLAMPGYWQLGPASRAKALRRAIDRATERAKFEFGKTIEP